MEILVTETGDVLQPIKLTRLQSICLDYQFRLQMKSLKKARVSSSEAVVIVNAIATEYDLPLVQSEEQLNLLFTKYKLSGFICV